MFNGDKSVDPASELESEQVLIVGQLSLSETLPVTEAEWKAKFSLQSSIGSLPVELATVDRRIWLSLRLPNGYFSDSFLHCFEGLSDLEEIKGFGSVGDSSCCSWSWIVCRRRPSNFFALAVDLQVPARSSPSPSPSLFCFALR